MNEEKYCQKLKQSEEHIAYLDQINADQLANSEKQLSSLRKIIDLHRKQLQEEKLAKRELEQNFRESLYDAKNEAENLKDQLRN